MKKTGVPVPVLVRKMSVDSDLYHAQRTSLTMRQLMVFMLPVVRVCIPIIQNTSTTAATSTALSSKNKQKNDNNNNNDISLFYKNGLQKQTIITITGQKHKSDKMTANNETVKTNYVEQEQQLIPQRDDGKTIKIGRRVPFSDKCLGYQCINLDDFFDMENESLIVPDNLPPISQTLQDALNLADNRNGLFEKLKQWRHNSMLRIEQLYH
ncbi:unnamed protein product [Didymodactylos carnosus]|uniref:Uncharacterized protein n=1 Tax=Didymodactylos carnosus TaxID=1234261 RepID=A0A814GFP9_9BILA|nr:unnamed protein product [Didymodactylos carnosus]CAF0995731.1 unnamed protein product [Didymodactylos carnosus]CAF3666397.1 unnamed protein product [Didymodactylos carnosus]CAF3767367.1 unnamed protein product [Didymodactylos carnosus]